MNDYDIFSNNERKTNFSELFQISVNENKNNAVKQITNNGDFLGTFSDAIPILRNSYQNGEQNKIISGIKEIDQVTGGIRKGQLWVVGARPGCGKTTFAINLLTQLSELHQGISSNNKSLFISLEMSKIEIFKKFVSISTITDLRKTEEFFNKYFTKKENDSSNFSISTEQINKFTRVLKNNYLFFAEFVQESNLELLENTIREAVSKNDVKVVVIDYFQLIGTSTVEFGTRSEKLATISRALKRLAKNLNINIILLSQLSRDFEKKGIGITPTLADLRETGSLEQDADVVFFLYENNEQFKRNKTLEIGKQLNLYVAKNRNGATKEFGLTFWLTHSIMFTESQMEAAKESKKEKVKQVKEETPTSEKVLPEWKPVTFELKQQEIPKIETNSNNNNNLSFLDLDTEPLEEGQDFYVND